MKITPRKYAQALALIFDTAEKTEVSAIIINFLKLLQRRNRMRMLPKILQAFDEEWLKRRGYKRIELVYPKSFEESSRELEQRLNVKFGGKIHIKTYSSDELIGGFQVKIDDVLVDASVSSSLKKMAKKLISLQ